MLISDASTFCFVFHSFHSYLNEKTNKNEKKKNTEDHWSCTAHLSAEDMLKSAAIEEKKFKHSPMAEADNPFLQKHLCQQEGLTTRVI